MKLKELRKLAGPPGPLTEAENEEYNKEEYNEVAPTDGTIAKPAAKPAKPAKPLVIDYPEGSTLSDAGYIYTITDPAKSFKFALKTAPTVLKDFTLSRTVVQKGTTPAAT